MVIVEIITVDKVGRVVLPKETRDKLQIENGTKLLVVEVKEDTLVLKKLNIQEMKKQLDMDLENVDLEGLLKRVRVDTNEKVKGAYPEILG